MPVYDVRFELVDCLFDLPAQVHHQRPLTQPAPV
jgi:hypothetical protein